MDNAVDPITTTLVRHALDAAVARQAVHAHNIANANTPGYRAKAVSFQAAVDIEAARTQAPEPVLHDTHQPVNLASEVAAMAENSLQYQSLVRLLNRHLSIAAIALNDGRR